MSDDTKTDTRVIVRGDGVEVLRTPRAVCRVVRGKDAGAELALGERRIAVIGTHPDCDLVLHDDSVSRRHLEIRLGSERYVIRDLDSKNGLRVGGLRVTEAIVDDVTPTISLGETDIQIKLVEEDGPSEELSARGEFGRAIGRSPLMRALFAQCEKAAASEATVLLHGESGTGKEVIASALHRASPRAAGPFVVVDGGSIVANLAESELFGHERGAFTGADSVRRGAFEEASGGTLFIDEIGELPLALQPVFLRVLEERAVRRVGGTGAPRKVDVRIIAASNRNLSRMVDAKEFRADLYFRLAVVKLTIPPLRQRPEDITALAEHFLAQHGADAAQALTPAVLRAFANYAWPGNVRELRNAIDRLVAVGDLSTGLDVASKSAKAPTEYDVARRDALDRFEAEYCRSVLLAADGAVSRAAGIAGLSRQMLYRLMQRHDIPVK